MGSIDAMCAFAAEPYSNDDLTAWVRNRRQQPRSFRRVDPPGARRVVYAIHLITADVKNTGCSAGAAMYTARIDQQ